MKKLCLSWISCFLQKKYSFRLTYFTKSAKDCNMKISSTTLNLTTFFFSNIILRRSQRHSYRGAGGGRLPPGSIPTLKKYAFSWVLLNVKSFFWTKKFEFCKSCPPWNISPTLENFLAMPLAGAISPLYNLSWSTGYLSYIAWNKQLVCFLK